MQAIILAAGMGKRLKKFTKDRTKCMVEVNGVPLVKRVLSQLDRLKLSRIVIVVGYCGEDLIEYCRSLDVQTPLEFVDNPIYDKTNNIYSLALAKDYLLREDTLLLESDLIFDDSVLDSLVQDPRPTLALVDRFASWMDGTCIRIDHDDRIIGFIPGSKLDFTASYDYYKTVNIYKFSREFSETHYVPFLDAYRQALGENSYYEQVLRIITLLDDPGIVAKRLDPGQHWYEIDDEQDLDIASTIFADSDAERLELYQKRYGGYWRYPEMIDYCYLVNPFYPPYRMVAEMQSNFPRLMADYPSGQAVNSLITAKSFGLSKEYVAVGNGAAELIKILMEQLDGRLALVRPTFEEYPNRLPEDQRIVFLPKNEDFSYSVGELVNFCRAEQPAALLLINPDNPSGHYLNDHEVTRLADETKTMGIRLFLDESFSDFATDSKSSHLNDAWLEAHPHCVVVKSISKSFGVAGLRLGFVACAEKEYMAQLRKQVSIWNINSMGEFYLQIMEKYKKDYLAGLQKLRDTRHKFCQALADLSPQLRVYPTEANFVMVELTGGLKSADLAAQLLTRHDIFIKDLSPKMQLRPCDKGRQFIRLSIRRPEENAKLLEALKTLLNVR